MVAARAPAIMTPTVPFPSETAPRLRTVGGLRSLSLALAAAAVAQALDSFVGVITYQLAPTLATASTESPPAIPPAVEIGLGAIAVLVLFLLIAIAVLGLVGMYRMADGKREYPEPHPTGVRQGTWLVALFIFLQLVLFVATAVVLVPALHPPGDPVAFIEGHRQLGVASLTLGLLGVSCLYLGLMRFVAGLAGPSEARFLHLALLLNLAGTAASTGWSYALVTNLSPSVGLAGLQAARSIGTIPGILAAIGMLSAFTAYARIRQRLLSGEVRPVESVLSPDVALLMPEASHPAGRVDLPLLHSEGRLPTDPRGIPLEPVIPPPGTPGPRSGPWWADDASLSDPPKGEGATGAGPKAPGAGKPSA